VAWDWRAFIDWADGIKPAQVVTSDEIARARSAISRAYYGAFHAAWLYALTHGYSQPRSNRHDVVWQWLQDRARSLDERLAGEMGTRLMSQRQRADYKDPTPSLADAKAAIKNARQICALLPAATPAPAV
jgi:uncharacterized protein (UPF0332 family)